MSETIKLNIGAGGSNLPGFIPIDALLGHDALKLEYADNSVDEVYASHVLEHIHHSKMLETVCEWVRVLKPDGRLRIAVPDFDKILEEFRSGKRDAAWLAAWMHGSADHDLDRHRNLTNEENLTAVLRRCGIESITPFEPEFEDWSKSPFSLNLQGFKRNIVVPREPKVCMVLSTPRVGFMDLMDGVADTCKNLGWAFEKRGGTEWGKGLTAAIINAINKHNPDYIMCLDYDSVFTADDCREMLRLMQANPNIGAMYPVEAHRHSDVPLGFDTGGTVVYKGELTQVASGHFGCTIIRREVFDRLPHPWFFSMPNPDTGLWSENNIDADITFWVSMNLHGWHVCQANTVQIGHMELCVKWCKPDGIMWQPIQHYRKHGKPAKAVFDGEHWKKKNLVGFIEAAQKAQAEAASPPITPPPPPTTTEPEPIDFTGGRLAAPVESKLRAPTQTFPESPYYQPKPVLNGQER